jgi:UrcA family protein
LLLKSVHHFFQIDFFRWNLIPKFAVSGGLATTDAINKFALTDLKGDISMFKTSIGALVFALTVNVAHGETTASVRFADLDLSSPSDVRVLDARVHKAAETVCASLADIKTSLYYRSWHEKCVQRASQQTSARIAAARVNIRTFANK